MARYQAGARTGAGSTTLPIISLYAAAAVAPKIREIGIFNATNTQIELRLVRMTSQGTPGTGLTESKHDPDSVAASGTAFATHSVAPTLGDDLSYRGTLGAAIGAAVIWTFGDSGLRIPIGTGNGIGVIVETGTGQVTQSYIVWDE